MMQEMEVGKAACKVRPQVVIRWEEVQPDHLTKSAQKGAYTGEKIYPRRSGGR